MVRRSGNKRPGVIQKSKPHVPATLLRDVIYEEQDNAPDSAYATQTIIHSTLLTPTSLPLQWEWLDINTLIIDVLRFKYISMLRGRIRLRLTRALPLIIGIQAQLVQAVTLLLDIALAYTNYEDVIVKNWIKNQFLHIHIQTSEQNPFLAIEKDCAADEEKDVLLCVQEIIQLHGGQFWIDCSFKREIAWHFTLRLSNESLAQKCLPARLIS